MICPRCGKDIQLSDDSRFCSGCGLEFVWQPNVPQQETNIALQEEQVETLRKLDRELEFQKESRDAAVKIVKFLLLTPLKIMFVCFIVIIIILILL
jgi:uncharacterized membrane protein YvbJ